MNHADRYSRQERFAPIGLAGQQRLAESRVLVVGVGALGSASAQLLVRAGVGFTRLLDRDVVELSNLQRQVLFDEADALAGAPKAVAAAQKLRGVNSQVAVEPVVGDLTHHNIAALAGDCDLVIDGTDNFETRLLVNDYCLKHNKPWVYGGVLGAEGQVMPVLPGETPCLACLAPEPPAPGAAPTCDTAGVLGPAVGMVAALQAAEALKLLTGNRADASRGLTVIDLWRNHIRQLDLSSLQPAGTCRACGQRDYAWLEGRLGSQAAVLCGRNAVQVRPMAPQRVDLAALADRLSKVGDVTATPFLVRLRVDAYELTLFADGRAIVGGVEEESAARSVLARYVGA
ncbi:Molybdopterin-synthase adenylyltransferase [Pirellulimonas nuda]|uniref:Molybdopterin-synthase adenylyltransferase n=1 Tax=Pirellulimonas nuda TaxID=2528009 RepID=A0A518DGG2_9BACT|nr:ThiF family adenylyltransferase [Pirellulimonas nuda]QDU90564.1 Molybdopterin-synthase adenylyltransferase [Pirellulimonas nuda]